MNLYGGVDPGVESGALGIVSERGGYVCVYDAPWLASGAGGRKQPDLDRLEGILSNIGMELSPSEEPRLLTLMAIEEIRPHGPKISTLAVASIVSSYWAWRAKAHGRWPIDTITPQQWRRAVGLPTKKGQTAVQKRDAVLDKARGLWPGAPLELKKHDGRAAALLIAEAGRRMHMGGI